MLFRIGQPFQSRQIGDYFCLNMDPEYSQPIKDDKLKKRALTRHTRPRATRASYLWAKFFASANKNFLRHIHPALCDKVTVSLRHAHKHKKVPTAKSALRKKIPKAFLLKGTVPPDWICMRVVPLDRPWERHQPL